MISRIQHLRNAACPLLQCTRRVLPATKYAPMSFCTSPRSMVRVRSRKQPRQHQHSRMLSSKGKEPTPVATTDWNLQYPSPSAIDVTPLAESLRSKVREFTRNKEHLKLIGILANEGSHRLDSEIYSDRIQQIFEEDGIDYEVWEYPERGEKELHNDSNRLGLNQDIQQRKLRWINDRIKMINSSSDIDGVLVFYPILPFGPKGPYKCRLKGVYYKTQDDHIRDLIHPSKDVEGLCRTKWLQIRNSRQKEPPAIYPCTALSVLRILEEYHIHNGERNGGNSQGGNHKDGKGRDADNRFGKFQYWKDQTISIVNRSEIMGRPLAVMLAEKGASVYSIDIDSILQFRPDGKRLRRCNPKTTTLESCLEESTVVVTGVPNADFRLPLSSIQHESTIVNVSEFPNVCEETLFKERPDIKYIPQVGKVTVATLSLNLMHLKQNSLSDGDPM